MSIIGYLRLLIKPERTAVLQNTIDIDGIDHRSKFHRETIAKNMGLYSDIENCYLLAYICRVAADA